MNKKEGAMPTIYSGNTTKQDISIRKTLTDAGFGEVLYQRRFVLYKKVTREGKITKVPYQVNGSPAESTNKDTWGVFDEVMSAYNNGGYDGIGIILGDYYGTKIVGVDLDHVCDNLSGKFTNVDAEMAVAPLKTYGEYSVSGTGVHYLFKDQDVPKGYKTRTAATAKFDMEIYEGGRYFTLSGSRINSESLSTDIEGLDSLCKEYMPKRIACEERKIVEQNTAKFEIGFNSVATALDYDKDFAALYSGKRPLGSDESRNDLALINKLVKYVGRNADKVIAEFRKSGHYVTKTDYHKAKIDGREDYIKRTVDNAINSYFTGYTFDDVGNSRLYADTFGAELRFVPEWNCWVHYENDKWVKRAELAAQEGAKQLSDLFKAKTDEFAVTHPEAGEMVKSMRAHEKKIRSAKGIDAMLKLAKSASASSADIFDSNPMVISCKNGILDMATGNIKEHSYDDYCTNMAGFNYNPQAKAPLWTAFLDKVLPPDVQDFLQQCVGMAAVGKVYEEAMIFMIGNGSNGKSTIANIISGVFGDYAITLQPDIITASRDGKTPPDFAEVRGKRIVFISETEEGDRLSTKALKRLASNEKQSARRLYCQPEEWMPSHTVFYSTNHKPKIGSNDEGTWRRIKEVQFDYHFDDSEKVTNFAERVLTEEGEGVLAWCMEGARKFIANGLKLKTPQKVIEDTQTYREDEDYLTMFVESKCTITPEGRTCSSTLYGEYKSFCTDNGYFYKNVSDFNNAMAKITGIERVNVHGVKTWKGIKLSDMQDNMHDRVN
jgi:putative DNA primase/helicase